MFLQAGSRKIPLEKVLWMGIVNATPDSFSDGGRSVEENVTHALELLKSGAEILDIGGESTRPGATPVPQEIECGRILPVLRGIRQACEAALPVFSIDTYHPETARAAIAEGATLINDVSGVQNAAMLRLLQETDVAVCFMHGFNCPQCDGDITETVFQFLAERRDTLLAAGIARERLIADVGLGFGKSAEENWELVRNIQRFHELGVPLLVGHSRKRFLGTVATHTVSQELIAKGVQILRVHSLPDNRSANPDTNLPQNG